MKRNKVLEAKPDIPSLDDFGKYRAGLTADEIAEYLCKVYNVVAVKNRKECPSKIIKQFYDIAGTNTVAVGPDGQSLMYRHDVQRFVGKLFFNTETYFD